MISLSLMVLLTVLAVGLLTLSSISLRSASSAEAMQIARSNARLALMLAIGQLQKSAGPDQRITAPANLVDNGHPSGVAGVWKSWRPPQEAANNYGSEKDSRFVGYMMSSPEAQANPDPGSLPGAGNPTELLVGDGSLGPSSTDRQVIAPLVTFAPNGAKDSGALAWATLDEGVKGRIDLPPNSSSSGSVGESITRVGAPARNKAGKMKGLEALDEEDAKLIEVLPKLVSVDEVNLMAEDKSTFGPYFHDFSVCSNSVQTDAADGGLKTDLSVLFDTATLPTDYSARRLYSGTNAPLGGSNSPDPMWAMYHHHYRLYQRTTANDNPKDGLKNSTGSRYRLSQVTDRNLRDVRYEPNMATVAESVIMPTMVKVEIVFSLVARDAHGGWPNQFTPPLGTYPYMLHMMYMPVITMHNPYNVPLRFTQLEVEFVDLPMGFQFFVNGQAATTSTQAFNQLYSGKESGNIPKIFKLVLTGDLTRNTEVVMGPGETRIFGKPFPPNWTWNNESAGTGSDGVMMFDWRNDKTAQGNRIIPGMITGPNDGLGYDIDWLAATNRATWLRERYKPENNGGCIPIKPSDSISVQYGPKSQASTPTNKFSVTMRLTPGSSTNNYSTTQVFFKDEAKLKSILEEGTSPRFSEPRSFPETYPKPTKEAPITAANIYEANSTPVSGYRKAKPFAIFSLSGKTTMDSFTQSRPVTDTGATMQMATCDFTTTASQGSSPFEFVLTPVRNGTGGIESDGVKGFYFGGHGQNRGTTAATFYEIPQAPMQSIAQMRHANAGSLGTVPYVTYSIGESRAHPALPSNTVRFSPDTTKTQLDHSWLANDQLWDRYWFSTLASLSGTSYSGSSSTSQLQLAKSFFAGEKKLPNARNVSYLAAGTTGDKAASEATGQRGVNTAAYIMTKGGFNVNSVSKAAWLSVLTALSDSSVPIAAGRLEQTGDDVPMLRVRRPTGGLTEGREAKNQLWNSYRKLSSQEIDKLAEEIVKEVRDRGPFLSMSDFVNRRLSGGDFAQKGALQAAIDRCDLNGIMESNATPISPSEVANYGWKNATAVTGTTGSGAPGEISQGDVLSAIGSFVTVRSDTFRIRTFGDCRDKDGKILARAWCEATVQRFPEYVDPADTVEAVANSDVNKAFGRRFSVVAFRWLQKDEV